MVFITPAIMVRAKLKIVVCICVLMVLVLNSTLWSDLKSKFKSVSSDSTLEPAFDYTLLYKEMSHHSNIMNYTWRNEPIHKRNNATKPFIAVVACAYSKKVANKTMDSMSLATKLLPSLIRTMETKAFDFALFVGVDDDDPFWANKTHQDALWKLAGTLPVHIAGFPAKKSHIPLNEILKVIDSAWGFCLLYVLSMFALFYSSISIYFFLEERVFVCIGGFFLTF